MNYSTRGASSLPRVESEESAFSDGSCSYCGGVVSLSRFNYCFLCRFPNSVIPVLKEGYLNAQSVRQEAFSSRIESALKTAARTGELVSDQVHPRIVQGRPLSFSRGRNWEDQREKALERDGYRCQECGISDEEHRERDDMYPPGAGLHVHHSVPFPSFDDPDEANRLGNLETLCFRCHVSKGRGSSCR